MRQGRQTTGSVTVAGLSASRYPRIGIRVYDSALIYAVMSLPLMFDFFLRPPFFTAGVLSLQACVLSLLARGRMPRLFFTLTALFFASAAYYSVYRGVFFHDPFFLKRFLVEKAGYFSSGELYGIVKSIATGKRDFLSADSKELFSNTGSYHLIAISGLHFGMVMTIFGVLLKKIAYNIRQVMMMFFMTLYLFVTDFYVSSFRAYLMIMFFLLSRLLKSPSHPVNIWALSGMVMIAVNPSYFHSLGFWLSMTATLGIILMADVIRKTGNILLRMLLVTLSAQAAVFPLICVFFGKYNVMSPVMNIFSLIFLYPLVLLGLMLLLPMPHWAAAFIVPLSEKAAALFTGYLAIFDDSRFILHFQPGRSFIVFWYSGIFMLSMLYFTYRSFREKRQKAVS